MRRRDALTVGVSGLCLAYALLMVWRRGSSLLPPVTWVVAPILLVCAAGLVAAGRAVRATVRGTAKRPVEPLVAYRLLRLAQACALAGAAAAGAYLALVLAALPDIDAPSVRGAALAAGAIALAAAALGGIGLWVQSMCRIDPPRPSRDGERTLGADPENGSPPGREPDAQPRDSHRRANDQPPPGLS